MVNVRVTHVLTLFVALVKNASMAHALKISVIMLAVMKAISVYMANVNLMDVAQLNVPPVSVVKLMKMGMLSV